MFFCCSIDYLHRLRTWDWTSGASFVKSYNFKFLERNFFRWKWRTWFLKRENRFNRSTSFFTSCSFLFNKVYKLKSFIESSPSAAASLVWKWKRRREWKPAAAEVLPPPKAAEAAEKVARTWLDETAVVSFYLRGNFPANFLKLLLMITKLFLTMSSVVRAYKACCSKPPIQSDVWTLGISLAVSRPA